MTDLTAARLLCEKMTAGEWEATICDDNTWMVNTLGEVICDGIASINDEEDAAGIVLAVSLLRALCDEGAVEAMARVIDPVSFSEDYLPTLERKMPGALERRQGRAAKATTKAQAIITSIFDAAGREG